MAKKSITLYLLVMILVPCEIDGNVMTVDPSLLSTIFEYDENQLAIRNAFTNDQTKLQQFRAAIQKFFNQGYDEGDAKNFMAYFECAIADQKKLLEVYMESDSKKLWNDEDKKLSVDDLKNLTLPADLENTIIQHDKWIPIYETQIFDDESFESNRYADDTPKNAGTHPFPLVRKSLAKIRPTTTFSPEEAKTKLLLEIKELAANWFYILSCESPCPGYVFRLQRSLQQILFDNFHIYGTVTEVYWKFSVNAARSYKIMNTTHHKLMKNLKKRLNKNEEDTFEQLLFKCVPSWLMTYEQIFFLNVLKDACAPHHNEPLRYYPVQNNKNVQTFIIYDSSKRCARDQINNRSALNILVTTLKYRNTRIFKHERSHQ